MWWIVDQQRLRDERLAIEALEADWFQSPEWDVKIGDDLSLELTFEIVLPRGRFPLRLKYHSTFPASPPSVRPLDGETSLSSHQYGAGGDLCLDIRNDNWTPDVTGADMIESARRLLEIETPTEEGDTVTAPSAHDYPLEMGLRSKSARFYIEPLSRIALMADDLNHAKIEIGLDYKSGTSSVAHVLSIGNGEDGLKPATPETLRRTCWIIDGYVIVSELGFSDIEKLKTKADLQATLGSKSNALDTDKSVSFIVRSKENLLTLVVATPDADDLLTFETVYAPIEQNRSGSALMKVAGKRIGIVGLGSIGAKVAISLARSGFKDFDLVDPDILHVGNLERHEGDWRDVGQHKADLCEHRMHLLNNHIKVRRWRSAIGAQVSSQEAANVSQALAACDLLIDASGNPDVFNHLAGHVIRHNRDLVWGSVYAGGVGGEIGRARLGKDPSPYDVRGAINGYYETAESPAPIAEGRGYDGSVGEGTPLVATDSDVERIAAHVTALAIDTLLGTEPSVYDEHAYLVGFQRAWLFDGPFDTHPILADAPIRHRLSPPEGPGVESDFIGAVIKKALDEAEN